MTGEHGPTGPPRSRLAADDADRPPTALGGQPATTSPSLTGMRCPMSPEPPRATAVTRCPEPTVTPDPGYPPDRARPANPLTPAGEVVSTPSAEPPITNTSPIRAHQRQVLMTTCQTHGAAGFTNLLVTKEGGYIVSTPRRKLLRSAPRRTDRHRALPPTRAVAGNMNHSMTDRHHRTPQRDPHQRSRVEPICSWQ